MSIETELTTYLKAHIATVTQRVYPLRLPDSPTLPALTYGKVSAAPEYAHDGPAGLTSERWQFSCWALTYAAARAIANEVKTHLSGYSGDMGALEIGSIFVANEIDLYDPEPAIYHIAVDCIITHED